MIKKMLKLLVIFTIALTFNDVLAEEVSKSAFVNCGSDNFYLNIRSTPSTAGSLVAALSCNTSFIVIDDNAAEADSYKWYKIKFGNNQEGYVASNYVAFDYIESESSFTIDETKGYVSCTENDDPLSVRPSIESYGLVTSLSCDSEMTIVNKNSGSNGRCSNWYYVTSGNYSGYVCGTYVYHKGVVNMDETKINNYKSYLRSIGFADETYLDYLVTLHAEHPTWQFRAINTKTNWDYVISQENVKGRSLIYYTYSDGYRSKESYSYNWATDTYYRHPTETNWWYASDAAVRYYMDPRNFLNSSDVFMFESLYYQPLYQNTSLVRTMLDGSFMPNIYENVLGAENRYTYADDFIEASSTYNVSPIHLASRILQEGNSTTSITYGENNYTVYNFFNIAATGANPQYKGLLWASGVADSGTSYGRPWDTPKKSILGGAQFLAGDYIAVGQNNLYLQKYAVYTTDANVSLYAHQYMQNITAPLTEGRKSLSSYTNMNKLDSAFVFIIPVYQNMPTTKSSVPSSINPNSYLSSITIDGNVISDFAYNKTTYNVTVPNSTTSISLGATNASSKGSVTGTGNINVSNLVTTVNLISTAQDGTKTTYTINISREKSNVNTLNSISIDKINFEFNKDTLTYNLKVNYDISTLNITYEKTDTYSTVVGLTTTNLNVGSNKLEYVVTAENGEVKTYIINIIRSDQEGSANLSSINTLKELKVKEKAITYDKDVLTYNLTLEYEINKLSIEYVKDDAKSEVNVSNTNLNVGNNTINVVVSAENGEIRTYIINVIRLDMSAETILSGSSVKYNDNYISGINIGTNVDTLINKVKSVNNNATISITDKDKKTITNTSFKTGYYVNITMNDTLSTYQIVILGDIDGDGETTKSDLLAIQKHIFGFGSLNGVNKEASDIDLDDEITKSDLLAIQKHIFGFGNIIQ